MTGEPVRFQRRSPEDMADRFMDEIVRLTAERDEARASLAAALATIARVHLWAACPPSSFDAPDPGYRAAQAHALAALEPRGGDT